MADIVDKVGDEPDEALGWSPLRSFLRTHSVNLRQLCGFCRSRQARSDAERPLRRVCWVVDARGGLRAS